MNGKTNLDPSQAARLLTVLVLRKADRVFPRMRRVMENEYGLVHGLMGRV